MCTVHRTATFQERMKGTNDGRREKAWEVAVERRKKVRKKERNRVLSDCSFDDYAPWLL